MAGQGNIVISDESALHLLMHGDWSSCLTFSVTQIDPLQKCATSKEEFKAFNALNPLYGPPPISLLVQKGSQKRQSDEYLCRIAKSDYPSGSFFLLRDGLYVATPELVYLRMGYFSTESQLVEIGTNLCGRYYIDYKADKIVDRTGYLTTPDKLKAYIGAAVDVRGSKKALSALRWVAPNSASPYETKVKMVFCHPLSKGGFGLPLSHMNYDIQAGRLQHIMAQSKYSLDLADPRRKVALEYDGDEYHQNSSDDKRRRNELTALGWTVYPIDKAVFHDPDATIRLAEQIARRMKVRLRRSPAWEQKYLKLRQELHLPT